MRPRIAVIFYSVTGNTARLAQAVADGAAGAGADVRLRQVEEVAPVSLAPAERRPPEPRLADVPIATIDDLVWSDGVALGSPTRYGNMAAQLKLFLDQTGALWRRGALVGKVASVFTSTATQHGGQETTLVSMMWPLFHLGYLLLGLPYAEQRQLEMQEIHGGSPYGVSSVSGVAADRAPTEIDLALAQALGRRLAVAAARMRS